jgi:tripartite-type tricarboxylate transporter receptor subunit TctC
LYSLFARWAALHVQLEFEKAAAAWSRRLTAPGTDENAMGKPAAATQDYPSKAVRIIEPFGAGGGPDLLARALAPKLSKLWGQPVTVENHPGAGATAAPALVAKSPPDGYTLLLNTSAQAYTAALSNSLPYDPLKDFIPVAALTTQPYVLVAGKPAGVTTLGELLAAATAKPGALRFASTGAGTGTHLGAVKFNSEASIKAVDVPPQAAAGIAEVLAGTIEGRTTYMFAPISMVTLPAIQDGRLVALGVSTARRSSLLPEVPTIAEAGIAGFDFPIWYGIWGPAGTPAPVVARLVKDIAHVIAGPDLRKWLAEHGADCISMTQPEFAHFVQSENDRAAQLMKAAGS